MCLQLASRGPTHPSKMLQDDCDSHKLRYVHKICFFNRRCIVALVRVRRTRTGRTGCAHRRTRFSPGRLGGCGNPSKVLLWQACKVLQGFDNRHLAACAARCFQESLFMQWHNYGTSRLLHGTSRLLHACYGLLITTVSHQGLGARTRSVRAPPHRVSNFAAPVQL